MFKAELNFVHVLTQLLRGKKSLYHRPQDSTKQVAMRPAFKIHQIPLIAHQTQFTCSAGVSVSSLMQKKNIQKLKKG